MTCIAVFRFTFLTWSNFYQTTYILIKQSRTIDLRRCIIASRARVPVILARATGANPSLRPPPLFPPLPCLATAEARRRKPRGPPGWRRQGSYPRRRGCLCAKGRRGTPRRPRGGEALWQRIQRRHRRIWHPCGWIRGDTGAASEARRRRQRRRRRRGAAWQPRRHDVGSEGMGAGDSRRPWKPWRHGVGSKGVGCQRQRAAVAAVEAQRRRQRRRHGRPWPTAWWLWLAGRAGAGRASAGGNYGRGMRWQRRWVAVRRQRLLQRWRQRLVGDSRWLDDGSSGYYGDRGYGERRHGGDRG